MTEPDAYRIRQNRITLASTQGEHSLREIMLQTAKHREPGSLAIERRRDNRWRLFGIIWND